MSSSKEYPVKSWDVSYYQDKTWRWISGCMSVTAIGITFISGNKSTEETKVWILFQHFAKVRNTTTGLIFGAVMVETNDGKKHWFSSLPDRDGIYNTIYHFWTFRLLPGEKRNNTSDRARSAFAKNLLSIVEDSGSALSAATRQLKEQGEQLDVTMATMYDLHNDLDVADNLVSGLENWLGRWKMPTSYIPAEPELISSDDIPEIYEWEILYAKMSMNSSSTQNLGMIRVAKDGVTILTMKQKCVHHFAWIEISTVRVISPWEIMLIKNLIGQPDLSFSVTCTNMIAILKLLDKRIKRKIHYDTPPNVEYAGSNSWNSKTAAVNSQVCTPGQSQNLLHSKTKFLCDDLEVDFGHEIDRPPIGKASQDQLTCTTNQKMTETDAEELSSALNDLKSLALAVRQEEETQNEKLDALSDTVERANSRLQETQKRVKSLT